MVVQFNFVLFVSSDKIIAQMKRVIGSLLAEDYLRQHMEEIINKAAEDVATFPEFARWRANPDIANVCKAMTNRTLPSDGIDNPRTNPQ